MKPTARPQPHTFIRSANPHFGSAYGGACAAEIDGIVCGWPADVAFHTAPVVPVTLYSAPGETGPREVPGFIADTPENRAALEAVAIPRCAPWREAHPEYDDSLDAVLPAPYCCSAYCDRCAGLRALNGDDPALLPNEWMH